MKTDAEEFLEDQRLRHIVKTYSDHISIPIVLITPPEDDDAAPGNENLNQASALWTRQTKSRKTNTPSFTTMSPTLSTIRG